MSRSPGPLERPAAVGPDPRALLDHAPTHYLRRVPGRETFLIEHTTVRAVAKRARERLWAWTRLLGGARVSAAEREHSNLVALAADGLPVPRAIGWAESRRGAEQVSIVVMECVEHTETLRDRLGRASASERCAWSKRLLGLVLRLHSNGWYHRDLYLQHLVVRGDELVLLDVGRARKKRAPRERWFVKDVAALLHSTPRGVSTRERLVFLARYLEGRGITGRPARRRFLARVLAKEARMSAHAPRAGEDRPWSDR